MLHLGASVMGKRNFNHDAQVQLRGRRKAFLFICGRSGTDVKLATPALHDRYEYRVTKLTRQASLGSNLPESSLHVPLLALPPIVSDKVSSSEECEGVLKS